MWRDRGEVGDEFDGVDDRGNVSGREVHDIAVTHVARCHDD